MAELRRGLDWSRLGAQDEEYLAVAVSHLLPRYYSGQPDDGTGSILRRLGDRLVVRHGDNWLRDVLRTPHSPSAAEAFTALKRAGEAYQADDSTGVGTESEKALRFFRSVSSVPGVLRAEFERQRARIMRGRYKDCAIAGPPIEHALRLRRYTWLLTQVLLDDGDCGTISGDFESEATRGRQALRMAARAGYFVLFERALGFSASRHRTMGNVAEVWRESARGLALYWTGNYPPIRAQHFYEELLLAAPDQAFNTTAALAQEAAETAELAGYRGYQAAALRQLAIAEFSVGVVAAATKHLKQSADLISTLPDGESYRPYAYDAETDIADLEARRGDLDQSLVRLLRIRRQAEGSDPIVRFQFSAALGRLRLLRREYEESRSLLEGALRIAERSLALAPQADRVPWLRTLGQVYRALLERDIRTGTGPRISWKIWSRYRNALFDETLSAAVDGETAAPDEAVLSLAELPSANDLHCL